MAGTTPERRRAWRRGLAAETLCVLLLRLKGWRILARRARTPLGEIDVVARRGGVLAFVEVKARASREAALEAIGPRQRRRLIRAAEAFVAARPSLVGLALRFDAMLVTPWRAPRHVADAWRDDA